MINFRAFLFAGVLGIAPVSVFADGFVVTLLGTGTPIPETGIAGPSTMVQAGDLTLVFDVGRDAVHRMTEAGVGPGHVDAVFVTHLHSDHLNGMADLLMTGWLPYPGGRRTQALPIYGPPGVDKLAEGLAIAYGPDIAIRINSLKLSPEGAQFSPQIFNQDGVVYEQDGVTVTAFTVPHGEDIKPAYGYRVDYDGYTAVISGDTTYSDLLIEHAMNVDLLIHEVFAANAEVSASPSGKRIASHHVTPEQAGEIFGITKPKMAAFTHVALLPPAPPSREEVLNRAKEVYDGPMVMGQDGMRFIIGKDGVTIE